jgi:hypothetical protein
MRPKYKGNCSQRLAKMKPLNGLSAVFGEDEGLDMAYLVFEGQRALGLVPILGALALCPSSNRASLLAHTS